LHALIEERYADAIAVLQRRIVNQPADREATAYLGIAGYLSGDYSERTAELLRTGTADPRAGRWASFYLGNLALMNGDLVGAHEQFDRLALVDDRVGREARAMLARLPE
jgi:Flp pilus assembly protein TadD